MDPEEDLHRQRTSSRINYIDGMGSREKFHQPRITERIVICRGSTAKSITSMKEDQGVDLRRQRIQESFYIDWRRKEGHPFLHQDRQNFKCHQIQVVYSLIVNSLGGQESTCGAIHEAPQVPSRKNLRRHSEST